MLSARTAAASPAASLWKRGGGTGGRGDGCTSCLEVRRRAAAVTVRAAQPKRVEAVAMESAAETAEAEKEVAAAGGGVEDKYGEDRATEELPVTPWAFSVVRELDEAWTLVRAPTVVVLLG